jgi:hypothetical protein
MAEHADTLRTYIAQLKELVSELQEITAHSRAILSAQRRAGGLTKAEAVDQLVQLLEGERWQRAEELRNRICVECHKGTNGKRRLKAIQQKAKRSRAEQRETATTSFSRRSTLKRPSQHARKAG